MKIRLGYVSISKALNNITPSSTFTYTNYLKCENKEEKLDSIIKSNLLDLKELIIYNIKNNIHFYRITSKLIPLATHKEVNFDYIKKYSKQYNEISKLINKYNIRVDTHPDQFCVLNSTNKEVIENSIRIINYHYNILKALGIKNIVIILHIGSSVFGKNNSISRFINNYKKLPNHLKKIIVLENDDKIYNVSDTLELSKKLNIPMVLDYHHHICNKSDKDIDFYLKDIFASWNGKTPKVHFSSPKNKTKKDFRSHHDYINSDDFIDFLNIIKKYNVDLDIMLEAKAKDDALFRLVRELKYKTNYKFIDETSFYI